MNEVTLTKIEMQIASHVGMMRKIESRSLGLKEGWHSPKHNDTKWDMDIEGAGAELAYCKFTNVYWTGSIGTFHKADVGNDIQIRHTTLQDGRLIVRSEDNPNHNYVLVIGSMPNYTIVGWIKGVDAIKNEFICNPNNKGKAYFVPQNKLNSMDSLIGEIKK